MPDALFDARPRCWGCHGLLEGAAWKLRLPDDRIITVCPSCVHVLMPIVKGMRQLP